MQWLHLIEMGHVNDESALDLKEINNSRDLDAPLGLAIGLFEGATGN